MHYYLFNGDADGIFALQQYGLGKKLPESRLITGVKRDIQLLSQVENLKNCSLAVFDISLDSNRSSLLQLLQNGNTILYFDHHFAGEIPVSPFLETFIDHSPHTCTSLIVNTVLDGKYSLWAICGAFGDNLHQQAGELAKASGLSEQQTDQLQEIGELFNYNGYGATLDDLHFHPRDLFMAVQPYSSPFDFIENASQLTILRAGYKEDIELAVQQEEIITAGKNRVYSFPDTQWARRVVGVFSNFRAREQTASAHAIITENKDGTLRISVRAPFEDRRDADTLCKLFPTGGGRAAAAGINNLPADQLDRFLEKFLALYP
jgi:hypothetical protein